MSIKIDTKRKRKVPRAKQQREPHKNADPGYNEDRKRGRTGITAPIGRGSYSGLSGFKSEAASRRKSRMGQTTGRGRESKRLIYTFR